MPPQSTAKNEAAKKQNVPAPEKPAKPTVERAAQPVAAAVPQTNDETQRAAAILAGKPGTQEKSASSVASGSTGDYVILIGAFSKSANVKQLQSKINGLGIKTFTEPLDTPQGKKTRVRAGPFASRDAAEKAQARILGLGVNGVIAAR